ncbi:glycosyl hydrolase family 61-domain-containing protein [Morchella snyderi]|nr:glycosyl hydrolase family 61-domain-containing protein [Morchella snyderi]
MVSSLKALSTFAAYCALLSFVSAHQNLHEFYVNGVTVGYEKCMRRPPSNNPVTDVQSTDIRCNVNGLSASGTNPVPGVCAVNAGDEITVIWDTSTHPGPIQHFLYGPISDALTADGSGAKWSKIDVLNVQDGKMANVIMMENAGKYTFKLPETLTSGEYLLRSEMLALHGAGVIGGGQFYIGCMQLKITGPGGDCSPKFSLPGIYDASQPEIYISDVYNGFNTLTYTAPGGPVATCTAGSGSGSTPASTTASASTTRTTTTASSSITPSSTIATSVVASATGAVVAKYGQCGGTGFTGSTNCASGSTCQKANDYYSQCL